MSSGISIFFAFFSALMRFVLQILPVLSGEAGIYQGFVEEKDAALPLSRNLKSINRSLASWLEMSFSKRSKVLCLAPYVFSITQAKNIWADYRKGGVFFHLFKTQKSSSLSCLKNHGGGCFNSSEYFSQAQTSCWQCNFAELCRFFRKHLWTHKNPNRERLSPQTKCL